MIQKSPTLIQKTVVPALNIPGLTPPPQNRNFQGTNNQDANVDEADLLKNDGTYIYTISGNSLNIILAYPFNFAQKVSHITLGARPDALFIEGNYLSLFGTYSNNGDTFTYVLIYDVTNRGNPSLAEEYYFEGSYFNGRKTRDGYVYILSTMRMVSRQIPTPWFDVGNGRRYLSYNDIFFYIGNYQEPLFVNIISFDLRHPNPDRVRMVSVITETAQNIYMSFSHIYFTYTDIGTGNLDYTVIHKVFVWRNFIIPFADAYIRGSIRNQFSLD